MSLEKIKSVLGAPFYEAEHLLLYQMDCVEGMRSLSKPVIDLTITSPPYTMMH